MTKKDLNEGYGIIVLVDARKQDNRIQFVFGKKVSEHCALVFNNLKGTYSYILINTGVTVHVNLFTSLAEAEKNFKCVEKMEAALKEKGDLYKSYLACIDMYNKLIKDKKFL